MAGSNGRVLAVVAVLVLILSLSPTLELLTYYKDSGGSAQCYREVVLIYTDYPDDLQKLRELGIDIIENYKIYQLAEITEEQKMLLKHLLFEVEEVPTEIHLRKYHFDPLKETPSLPSNLEIKEVKQEGESYYILQFIGPAKEEWKRQIQKFSVTFYDYIPYNAFIVKMNDSIESSVKALTFVRWIGKYQPAYKISPELNKASGNLKIVTLTFRDEDIETTRTSIENLDGDILYAGKTRLDGLILTLIDSQKIVKLANIKSVSWIGLAGEDFVSNHNARWVIQSCIEGYTPIHDKGIHGEGELITMTDTGCNYQHETFKDVEGDPPGDNHRKIQEYYVPQGATGDNDDDLGRGHGTHVACTILGDAPEEGGYETYNKHDGMAYSARLIVQDIANDYGEENGKVYPPSDYSNMFQPAYDSGSRVHSNSWGRRHSTGYNERARMIDDFMWTHGEFLILYAMGNEGPDPLSLRYEAEAKNIISVGGTQNGLGAQNGNMYRYSSRGPANDGRLKPTLIAPADALRSADHSTTDGYSDKTGTSMATPCIAGSAAMLRQYFIEGWYPSGAKNQPDSFVPSAALLKAVLVNSADEISGWLAYDNNETFYPNNQQGWGLINLDNSLYFTGDSRKLWVKDNAVGLSTGDFIEYYLNVDSYEEPLEITLVWTDYPATANADPALVNDLDLKIIAPNGTVFKGNEFTEHNPGYSKTGGEHDRKNVTESVLLLPSDIETGLYSIRVEAYAVNQGGLQPFALAVTGSFVDEQNDANSNADASDDFDNALEISQGDYIGFLGHGDEVDWYKFQVKTAWVIDIDLMPPSGSNFDLELYDPYGNMRANSTNDGDLEEHISFIADQNGYWRTRILIVEKLGRYSFSLAAPKTGDEDCRFKLEGYTKEPYEKWTTGTVRGWYEDEMVPYRFKIRNRGEATTIEINIFADYQHYHNDAYGVDYFSNFSWEGDGIVDPPNTNWTKEKVGGVGLEIQYNWTVGMEAGTSGDAVIILYWNAHLALTVRPKLGASHWPGPSLHVRTSKTGNQDVPIDTPPSGYICGYKWNDLDGNGTWDDGEPGLKGWTIWLTGPRNLTTTTNESGYYEFSSLLDGEYIVSEEQQESWNQTSPSEGTHSVIITNGNGIENNNFSNHNVTDLPEPPTNLFAQISEDDVQISWLASSSRDIHHYNIYRGIDISEIDYVTPYDTTITTNWTDHGAVINNSYNFFYVVRAVDIDGNIENNTNKVGKFVKFLPQGRQLISIPLVQSNESLVKVLETIEGKYDYVQWYDPLRDADHWLTFSTDKPSGINDVLSINHTMALWINMTSPAYLTVAGNVANTTIINLYKGWNFIGYPSFTDRNVSEALVDIPYDRIEGFDASNPPYFLRILGITDIMTSGNGYWICVTSDCVLTIYN